MNLKNLSPVGNPPDLNARYKDIINMFNPILATNNNIPPIKYNLPSNFNTGNQTPSVIPKQPLIALGSTGNNIWDFILKGGR